MLNQGLSKLGMYALDRLTDRFPAVVPKLFEGLFLPIAGNSLFNANMIRRCARQLRRVKKFDKMLVAVDVNIGDAVIMQASVRALKECFPDAEIDYACNAAGGTLVAGMPEIRHVHNLFTQFAAPSDRDYAALREVIRREQYDVIFNMCAFVLPGDLGAKCPVVPLFLAHASDIVRGWSGHHGIIHISHVLDKVVREVVAASGVPTANPPTVALQGSSVFLPPDALREAHAFLASHDVDDERRKVLIHADTPFRYTQVPLDLQRDVVREILRAGEADCVLLSTGNADMKMAAAILDGLSGEQLRRVVLVPRMSITAYAALIDQCDVFMSADTGPMHIAAARKVLLGGGEGVRNRTAVVGVYGATSTRMSGYDSSRPDHLPGCQSAPAKAFSAPTPCRNVSCVNKPGKTCAVVRCFDGLRATQVAEYINAYLGSLRAKKFRAPASTVSL